LFLEDRRQLGVIEVAGIPGGVGGKGVIQRGIRLPGDAEGTSYILSNLPCIVVDI
jgi:hypothetical protein